MSLSFVLALALLAAPEGAPAAPVAKIDRSRVVGAPVLEGGKVPPAEGVYVWLEDGLFHVAFVPPAGAKPKARKYAVMIASSTIKPEKHGAITFALTGGGARASAEVETVRLEGAIKAGESLTVSGATGPKGRVPIFLGPLATRAAASVTIGSFSPYRP